MKIASKLVIGSMMVTQVPAAVFAQATSTTTTTTTTTTAPGGAAGSAGAAGAASGGLIGAAIAGGIVLATIATAAVTGGTDNDPDVGYDADSSASVHVDEHGDDDRLMLARELRLKRPPKGGLFLMYTLDN